MALKRMSFLRELVLYNAFNQDSWTRTDHTFDENLETFETSFFQLTNLQVLKLGGENSAEEWEVFVCVLCNFCQM